MGRKIFTFLAVVAVISLLVAPAAIAGGKGKGGGSSIWIEDSLTAASADGAMHYTDRVMFGYSSSYTDNAGRGPWIELRCTQNGRVVYREWRAGFEGGYMYGEPHNVGPSLAWDGTAEADCTGILGHYSKNFNKFMKDATVDFDVMP